ncbi:MAG TPA: multicopper oxidase domain-containing protein [Gemmatimonadaceae bacterium]|nr:multicopper oxidase domain-containing protein [Gemmatimonadaceae bacterium]
MTGLLLALLQISALTSRATPSHAHDRPAPTVTLSAAIPNDNRVAGGRLANGVYTLNLEAREALWYPEGKGGPSILIAAFNEAGGPARAPGPMIRVPAGTEMRITVHNTLATPMRLWGLQDRSEAAIDSVVIAAGAMRTFQFRVDIPGTYLYWGRTGTRPPTPLPGVMKDAVLNGAFIVDPAGSTPRKDERVIMLSVFSDTITALGTKSDAANQEMQRELIPRERWFFAAVNGLSWPHTERLTYNLGDTVRWRVINASGVPHPMHLHGFYFNVLSRGDASRDTIYAASRQRKAVTEWMPQATTMTMTWVPNRPGNWVFHCHIVTHISDALRLTNDPKAHMSHGLDGMAGLIVGLRVLPKGKFALTEHSSWRRMRVFVTQKEKVYGDQPGYSYILQEGPNPPAADSIRIPSSTLTLRQGEPTEITVINRSKASATIHWHGIELESYYDGVGNWSGWDKMVAPPIAPGDSFVVRLTPERPGTFIYHTHTDENTQMSSGLYGALIVLPTKGEADAAERIFLIGIGGPGDDAHAVINGTATPAPIDLSAGVPHRLRFINISPLESHVITLLSGTAVQSWRALAKDGAELPEPQAVTKPGVLTLHPGETYDFEVKPAKGDSLKLRVSSPESIEVRRAVFLKGIVPLRDALPRKITEIPIIVH